MISCAHCGGIAADISAATLHYELCEKRPPGVHDAAKAVERASAMVSEGARRLASLTAEVEIAAAGFKRALDNPGTILRWFQGVVRGR